MAKLLWDQEAERTFETGTKQAAIYLYDKDSYWFGAGEAWNGFSAFTAQPSGAESTKLYANDGTYASLTSAEEMGASVECYTYPAGFKKALGLATPIKGMNLGQQARSKFGFVVKTTEGNDTEGLEFAYQLHLLYFCEAAPAEKSYQTINDSPEAATFSYEFATTPVTVGEINGVNYKPTAYINIESKYYNTQSDKAILKALEDVLYGSEQYPAYLPTPSEVYEILSSTPTGDESSGYTVTLPEDLRKDLEALKA